MILQEKVNWTGRGIVLILYNERKSLAVGFVSLFIIAVVLAIRNLYSFSWSDESFYLAEIHRLFLGGKPFVDEWHPTQFYAVLFLPFYNIYVKMKGGGERRGLSGGKKLIFIA